MARRVSAFNLDLRSVELAHGLDLRGLHGGLLRARLGLVLLRVLDDLLHPVLGGVDDLRGRRRVRAVCGVRANSKNAG